MTWFIMVMVMGRLMYVGPFTEVECKTTKVQMFGDTASICVERRVIDVKRKA